MLWPFSGTKSVEQEKREVCACIRLGEKASKKVSLSESHMGPLFSDWTLEDLHD